MIKKVLNETVLPVRNIVMFPNIFISIFVVREMSISAIKNSENNRIVLISQKDSNVDNPTTDSLFTVGVLCRIVQITKLSDDSYILAVEGIERVKLIEWTSSKNYLEGKFEVIEDFNSEKNQEDFEAHIQSIVHSFEEYANIQPKYSPELIESLSRTSNQFKLVNMIASNLPIKLQDKQALLEKADLKEQVNMLLKFIELEKYMSELEHRIRSRIKTQVEQTQKEVLREQLNALQKEIGEEEDEISLLEKRMRDTKLSEEAREKVETELKRIRSMNPMSAEASIARSYIECILDLPWGKYTTINKNLEKAEDILNKHHYGLEKVKERIYEFIALQTRMDKVRGPILCLFGPPGVGKTSLAKSIAEATGRPFIRIALGGMKDESEIRGHRRTYIGSMPGRIIQGLRGAKFSNPLILLDEIGNIGKDWKGDPEAALLEVLDPEQNSDFKDNYLEVGFDLSNAIFIATTNSLNLQPALQDRFEIVKMSGYTDSEKKFIAVQYLVPRERENHALEESEFSISENAIESLIRDYTREAGLRALDREIANLARKSLRKIEQAKLNGETLSIHITKNNLKEFAGIPKYRDKEQNNENMVGVTCGLAWTEMGGEILYIEAVVMTGTGKLVITGKLGDVMQESAKAALSLIRSKAEEYKIEADFFKNHDIHIHVPEGAIPKDGPSAGITIFTSVLSAITKRKVKHNVAMTGELTLLGRILPIGGLKEKALAAHRANITTIIIPKDNEKDIEEIPEEVRKSLTIHMFDKIENVIKIALMK